MVQTAYAPVLFNFHGTSLPLSVAFGQDSPQQFNGLLRSCYNHLVTLRRMLREIPPQDCTRRLLQRRLPQRLQHDAQQLLVGPRA